MPVDDVIVRLRVDTGLANGEHVREVSVNRSEWESMSEAVRALSCEELAREFRNEMCEYSWEVLGRVDVQG